MREEFGPPGQFIAFDLETTGLSAAMDRMVEIAAVRFLETGQEIARYQTLVNPERPVPPGAYAVHGLSDELLSDAPTAREILPAFLAFIGDAGSTTLLAHNGAFDAGFLGTELESRRPADSRLQNHRHAATFADAASDASEPSARDDRHAPWLRSCRGHRAMADSLLVKQIWLRLEGARHADGLIAFKMFDAREKMALPVGWAILEQVVVRGSVLQIEYEGGTRGTALRSVTPRRLESRGGCIFLVALCHIDSMEKSFRVDRIRTLEFTPETGAGVVRVDRQAAES